MLDWAAAVFREVRYLDPWFPAMLALAFAGGWRARKAPGGRLALAGAAGLALLSWPPAAWLLNWPLEQPYREAAARAPDGIEAIVVLSGAVAGPERGRPYSVLEGTSAQRCRKAAWVYERLDRPVDVIVCGPGAAAPGETPVWELMARELEAWGVPRSRMRIEPRGQSTAEQARFAAEILRDTRRTRAAVVTDAFHMRRSLGAFRAAGIHAEPAPAEFRSFPERLDWRYFLPASGTIARSTEALRELAALTVYTLRGGA
jgi:uncharacterized SAM-binding protein YcdF (DUF218 family)